MSPARAIPPGDHRPDGGGPADPPTAQRRVSPLSGLPRLQTRALSSSPSSSSSPAQPPPETAGSTGSNPSPTVGLTRRKGSGKFTPAELDPAVNANGHAGRSPSPTPPHGQQAGPLKNKPLARSLPPGSTNGPSPSQANTPDASPRLPPSHLFPSNNPFQTGRQATGGWAAIGLGLEGEPSGGQAVNGATASRPRSWTLGLGGGNRIPSLAATPQSTHAPAFPTPPSARSSIVSFIMDSPRSLLRQSFASRGAGGPGPLRKASAAKRPIANGGGVDYAAAAESPKWRRAGGWRNRMRVSRWLSILGLLATILWWAVRRRHIADAFDVGYVNPDLFGDRPSISRRQGIPGLDLGLSSRFFTTGARSHSFSSLISLHSSYDPTLSPSHGAPSPYRFFDRSSPSSSPDEGPPESTAERLPSVGAVLHVPSPEKLASVEHLVPRLAGQTFPLSSLVLACPLALSTSCRSALDRALLIGDAAPFEPTVESYPGPPPPDSTSPFVGATDSLLSTMSALDADLVVLLEAAAGDPSDDEDDGTLAPGLDIGRGWLANLVRALGTKEYGGAVLSSAGLAFDRRSGVVASPEGRQQTGHCRVQRPSAVSLSGVGGDKGVADEEEEEEAWAEELDGEPIDPRWTTLQTTAVGVQLPSSPILLRRSWLDLLTRRRGLTGTAEDGAIGRGLVRGDLPPAAALGLALWQHARIPSFAIPFGGTRLEPEEEEEGEEEGVFRGLKQSFVEGVGVEQGCLDTLAALRRTAGLEAQVARLFRPHPEPSTEPHPPPVGPRDGVDGIETGEGKVAVMASSREEIDRVLRPIACGLARRHDVSVVIPLAHPSSPFSQDEEGQGTERVLYRFGGVGSVCELQVVSSPVGSAVAMLEASDVVVYVQESIRPEVKEALRKAGAVMEHQRGPRTGKTLTAIGLPRDQVEYADWLAALSIHSLRHWHTPRFDIGVITNNRPYSLVRLTSALQGSVYLGDRVHLNVHLEQTADAATQRLVDDLSWTHGTLSVRHRVVLGGLMPAIVESWYPSHNDSYGVILEDDVEVSPLFYSWLKFAVLHYRYDPRHRAQSARLFGVSLYQQRQIELRPEGRQRFDARALFDSLGIPATTPYLSQIPCSWGAAYFPEVWREFHAYLALRLSEVSMEVSDVVVPEIRSNRWPRSWKKYFIELVFLRGYSMLYPNYPDFVSFSTNHMEKGTHIHVTAVDIKRRMQFEVPLMRADESVLDLPGMGLPDWKAMPVLDLWGELASEREVVQRGWLGSALLGTCPTPWGIGDGPSFDAGELLCRRRYAKREETLAILAAREAAAAAAVAGVPAA